MVTVWYFSDAKNNKISENRPKKYDFFTNQKTWNGLNTNLY